MEDLLKGLGFKATKAPRGKSAEARETYSKLRKGSKSRLGGKKAMRKYSALRSPRDPSTRVDGSTIDPKDTP